MKVESSTQGILLPRLTSAERDNILNPVQGLFIYNKDENCINYYTGSVWMEMCGTLCFPDCFGRECGDDGCGGSCGTCGAGYHCEDGDCVPD